MHLLLAVVAVVKVRVVLAVAVLVAVQGDRGLVRIVMVPAELVELYALQGPPVVVDPKLVEAEAVVQAVAAVVPIMKAVVKIVAQVAAAVEVEYFPVLVVQVAAVKLAKTVALVDQEIIQGQTLLVMVDTVAEAGENPVVDQAVVQPVLL